MMVLTLQKKQNLFPWKQNVKGDTTLTLKGEFR